MRGSAREFLEALSQFCYVNKTPVMYGKRGRIQDQKYRKGVLQVYEWVDELCYFYLQKEKRIEEELVRVLRERYHEAKQLPSSSHREGLLQAFEEIFRWMEQSRE